MKSHYPTDSGFAFLVRQKLFLERLAGIEPALSGRKHDILPLNYSRNLSNISTLDKFIIH